MINPMRKNTPQTIGEQRSSGQVEANVRIATDEEHAQRAPDVFEQCRCLIGLRRDLLNARQESTRDC